MKSLNNKKKTGSLWKGLAACAAVLFIFGMTALSAFAAEGEITAETAKIRAQASTSSEVVGSTVKGKKIDILEVVQDSSGTKWYKVSVAGGGYGYIREDLVKTSETLTATSTVGATATEKPQAPAEKPADTVPTAIGEQAATVKCESNASVRSGASTSHARVSSLPNGTSITLIGEANDNAGNKWYQMTCNYNNRTIEGYIRSDLITIGGTPAGEGEGGGEAPVEGEEPAEGEAPAEGENPEGEGEGTEPDPVPEDNHNDYEIRWAQNQDNEEYDYFLYDNLAGNRMRLSEVMNAVTASNESIQKLESEADRNKIIIIVLAGVIVLLFVIITILIFKIRSLYYEDYDEDDEEEEEEEEVPVRKKVRRVVEEEEPVPVRKKKPAPQRDEAAPRRDGQQRREGDRPVRQRGTANPELRAAERKEGVKRPVSRKPQNFLVDDDEFEFEFLNMDDKDI